MCAVYCICLNILYQYDISQKTNSIMKLIPVRIALMKNMAVVAEAELAADESPARWADAANRLVSEVVQLQGLS